MKSETPASLEGTWAPVAASVSGKELIVAELRVKYLILDGHDYNIVDRSNQVGDRGEYLVNDSARPWTIDIVGRDGPNAGRSMLAIFVFVFFSFLSLLLFCCVLFLVVVV